MYIDTHCHLMFDGFDLDRDMVVGNAKKAGVKQIICPGVDPLSSDLAVTLAREKPGVVFASIGFHPYEAQNDVNVSYLEKILKKSVIPASEPESMSSFSGSRVKPGMTTVVAIGECGLDYHLYKGEPAEGKKQAQRILFEEQIRLALTHDLPLIMHCRDAYEDFFTVLDSAPRMPKGVIHCFSGGLQELRMAQERNLFVGIDGNLTYSKQLQMIVPHIPLSMLLLETDSPYLTPIPFRGKRNEPKHIPLIAKNVAELQNKTEEEVARVTTANAQTLFQLPDIR